MASIVNLNGKQKVLTYLRDQIENQRLKAGDKLQSTQDLANYLEVSLQTAHVALQILTKEGLLIRKPRSGTFVAEGVAEAKHKVIGVLFQSPSHMWDKAVTQIIRGCQSMSAISIPVEITDEKDKSTLESSLNRLDSYKPSILVTSKPSLAEQYPDLFEGRHVIRLDLSESLTGSFNGDTIIPDYEQCGYIATRHLIEKGHEKIAFFRVKSPMGRGRPARGVFDLMYDGYIRAMDEHRLTYREVLIMKPLSNDTQPIVDFLKGKDRPTAIFSTQDHRSVDLIKEAKGLGLRVPEDLALASAYNTPWAEAYQLTSVDFQTDIIVQHLLKIVGESFDNKRLEGSELQIRVEPKLIVRSSSG